MITERYPHQQAEFERNAGRPRLALAWDPRLGKTRAAIDFLSANLPPCTPSRILISAPLVVCPMWSEELEEFGYEVTKGYAFKRAEQLDRALFGRSEGGRKKPTPKNTALVLNVDRIAPNAALLQKWKPDAYIADECHAFQNSASKRTRAMRKVAASCMYLRFLSGTMAPNNVGNLWPFLQLVDPDMWEPTYAQFRRKHLICDYMFPSKIVGVVDPEEIERRIAQCTSRLTRTEVFGADQTQHLIRNIPLSEQAKMLYRQVADEWIATNEAGGILDATHALSRLIRLQQISAGYGVYDGVPETVDEAKVRAAAEEANELTENAENVVVFYRYHQEYRMLVEQLERLRLPHSHIDGSVSGEERASLVRQFNATTGALLVAQIAAGGIGISLASADYALFLTRSFSYVEDKQAQDRIYSPGRAKCLIYYERPGTVDKYIADVLSKKRSMSDAMMSGNLKSLLFGE